MNWPTIRQEAELVCTPAELAVLDLVARGLSQRTIARKLGISRSAVRSRIENARTKLTKTKEAA